MKYIILFLAIYSLSSCSKSDETIESFLDCDDIAENYKAYDGEDIECQFHFRLTKYDDQEFMELHAH